MPAGILAFLTVGGTGLLLALAGCILFCREKRKKLNCTAETVGKVARYSFVNEFPAPVVEFMAEGKLYAKKKRYRGVITVARTGLLAAGERKSGVYIDSGDIVHIRRGAYINLRAEAERLYPLGAPLPVWYNPKKPKQAYVERIPEKSPVEVVVFLWTGVGLLLLGILLGFLIG